MKAFLLFFLDKKGNKKNQDLIKKAKIFIISLKRKKPESQL
jgi:hypothetical protein